MKKQKLLAGLLALTMALALAACGGEEPAEEEPAAGEIGRASCRERV